MLRWRYRNAVHAETEDAPPRPLYWKNDEGWVTEDDNPTEFTTDEILRFPYPVEGYPEPTSTVLVFVMSWNVVVEVMDTLDAEARQKIENEWQSVWSETDYYPETDEEAVHETMKRLGIQMYRVLETYATSY